jgi:uncharacterized membrane protein YebE (DUF533 family)
VSGEPQAPSQQSAPPEYDEGIVQVLASKILSDWLRNRQQLLVPFTLDLQKLDAAQADVLMRAMVAAAHADGDSAEKVAERLRGALKRLNASAEQQESLRAIEQESGSLRDVLAHVPDVHIGAQVYAASLLALDRRRLVNRHYMRYLAARLDLPAQLARSLEQRFRPAV